MVSEKRQTELKEIAQIEDLINKSVKEEKESKELFSKKDIEVKTDISEEETSIIARLMFLCDELQLDNFRKAIIKLMELRVSKGRKSRKEYIEALKKDNQFMGLNHGGNIGGFSNGR